MTLLEAVYAAFPNENIDTWTPSELLSAISDALGEIYPGDAQLHRTEDSENA